MKTTIKPTLAVALDFDERKTCLDFADKIAGAPVVLKLGLRLLPKLFEGDVQALRKQGFKIFIDAKLHDIPSQVGGAIKAWADLGADFITVHLSGGAAMLTEAAKAAEATHTRVLGVSVLTSLNEKDLHQMGINQGLTDHVQSLAELGFQSGIDSFVCSVAEAASLRAMGQRFKQETFVTTPGLRLPGETAHADQSRSYTIGEALREGSSLLVVGRSILKSPDPEQTVALILESLSTSHA